MARTNTDDFLPFSKRSDEQLHQARTWRQHALAAGVINPGYIREVSKCVQMIDAELKDRKQRKFN
jgi:hypothetical protein